MGGFSCVIQTKSRLHNGDLAPFRSIHAHIVSHIERVAGVLPWIVCGICVLLGFFLFLVPWCFCCLPFCVDQCLDVVHSCPACKRNLGRFNRV
uniref:LITAF domain-containing protein n=1 Tax=Angiostrongylus cantonensis TaxID=6313 RepID=A0A0K0DFP5_ANGCA